MAPADDAGSTSGGSDAAPRMADATPMAATTETPKRMEATAASETEDVMFGDNRPDRLKGITGSWNTNWARHTVDYDEIMSGGPPRDGIPSIDDPRFVKPEEAAGWLDGSEPVIALAIYGEARAYPLQILTWHEIVNDVVGGVPVAVTFCPLCNSAIVFDRRLDGQVYEFGTSGLLRNSDLIMYDRTTESLWQQLTGEAIVGDLAGRQLEFLPASLVGFDDFRARYPVGEILSRDTGHQRSYGQNPYAGYDTIGQSPFLFDGEEDGRLPAMARVVTVGLPPTGDAGRQTYVAYPYSVLAEMGAINDTHGGHDLVVLHEPGTSSALDAPLIREGQDVGATGVFDPVIDGQKLTFRREGDAIVDDETGSMWDILGHAIAGPLAGRRLDPIVHGDQFWFAWATFRPDTLVYRSGE
jgi:hypothetical protein